MGTPGWPTSSVSVVLCTKDRRQDLHRAIASVRASGSMGKAVDIAVVEEAQVAQPIPGVRYVHLPPVGRGFGYARSVAMQNVGADIVIFLDDDCEVAAGWLEALMEPFRDRSVLGVAGAVLVRDCGLVGYAENILGFPGGGLRYVDAAAGTAVPTRHLSTCNCAYRRTAILEAGGFPENARYGGEDAILAERVNMLGRCMYAPTAVVYHRTRDTLPAVFRWFVRRGISEATMLGETSAGWTFLQYSVRSSWTLRLVALTTAVAVWPGLLAAVPAALATYYAVLLWRFRFARRYASHRSAWWVTPAVKLTMDLGTEVGRWKALLLRTA